jgi:hypothetical protein
MMDARLKQLIEAFCMSDPDNLARTQYNKATPMIRAPSVLLMCTPTLNDDALDPRKERLSDIWVTQTSSLVFRNATDQRFR